MELLPLGVPQTLPARFVDHRERALDQTLSYPCCRQSVRSRAVHLCPVSKRA